MLVMCACIIPTRYMIIRTNLSGPKKKSKQETQHPDNLDTLPMNLNDPVEDFGEEEDPAADDPIEEVSDSDMENEDQQGLEGNEEDNAAEDAEVEVGEGNATEHYSQEEQVGHGPEPGESQIAEHVEDSQMPYEDCEDSQMPHEQQHCEDSQMQLPHDAEEEILDDQEEQEQIAKTDCKGEKQHEKELSVEIQDSQADEPEEEEKVAAETQEDEVDSGDEGTQAHKVGSPLCKLHAKTNIDKLIHAN